MKKNYIAPSALVVMIENNAILAGSVSSMEVNSNATSTTQWGRGRNGASYEDEDEEDWDF